MTDYTPIHVDEAQTPRGGKDSVMLPLATVNSPVSSENAATIRQ